MEENIIDRISELPEFIIHHILSFLDSPVDLVRSSVLSKKWLALTASFPILDFNIHNFSLSDKEEDYDKDNFFKYVAYTTSRFCEQNTISMHTFKLDTLAWEPTDVDIIEKCVELILKKGVRVLMIEIYWRYQPLPKYCLPNILLSTSTLTSLTISGCELPSSLMVDAVKFKSLKVLELEWVHIDEEAIKCLTTSCPLLEEFSLNDCYGFRRFCVFGHQNLKKVEINYMSEVEIIDIEAPNLCSFFLMCIQGTRPPCMNLALCKKLKTFYYSGYLPVTSKGLACFFSNFPFLEILYLDLPDKCNNLKLSSHSLRLFVLRSQCDLEEIDLNTPNLLLFVYSDRLDVPSAPLRGRMKCYPGGYVDSLWFQKLRRFLEKNNGFKELKLRICTEDLMDVEELKMSQWQPFELEHVDLKPKHVTELSIYEAIVEAVLWCCQPRSLTLKFYFPSIHFEEWSHLVKLTYERLLQQEDQGHTNIRIVMSSSSSKAKLHFSNLDSLLTTLPHDQLTQKISFIKEQVVQEM